MSYAPRGRGNRSGGFQRQHQNREYSGGPSQARRYDRRLNHGLNNYAQNQNYNQNYSQNYGQNYVQSYNEGPRRHENQVWMGDLDSRWNEQFILDIWSQVGHPPVAVKILRDGRDGGYSFVSFSSAEEVQAALLFNGNPIPGTSKLFKLNLAGRGKAVADQRHQKPVNDFSIFVGDIGLDVSEPMVYEAFNARFPDQVKQVKIMMDNSSKLSKGFGFVRFYDAAAQNKALETTNGLIIGSRPIRVGVATGSKMQPTTQLPAENTTLPAAEETKVLPNKSRFTNPQNNTVVVRGLSGKLTKEELALHFSSFGEIIYCTLSSDLDTGYIKYYFRLDAESAILLMYGQTINNCRIRVSWGHGDTTAQESSTITIAPATNNFQIPKPLPERYGTPYLQHVLYDTTNPSPIIVDESEPQSIKAINQQYLAQKEEAMSIIKNAQL